MPNLTVTRPRPASTLLRSSEHEFISRADRLPRLERQLRKNNPHPDQQPTQLPLPQGLGDDDWVLPEPNPTGPKIAFIVTTAESVTQIRVWLAYHRAIGVSLFYLFVEGNAATPESMAVLRAEEGVKVIPRDKELEDKQAKSRIWKETWLSAFFNKPCNHELFVKQSLNMEGEFLEGRPRGREYRETTTPLCADHHLKLVHSANYFCQLLVHC